MEELLHRAKEERNTYLEAFAATKFNKILSDRQPRQSVEFFQSFRD
jgi:hypothetical protein